MAERRAAACRRPDDPSDGRDKPDHDGFGALSVPLASAELFPQPFQGSSEAKTKYKKAERSGKTLGL
jgi:hypothetical protein